MQATKIGVMARYEMLMHWRRYGVLMVMLLLLIMVGGLGLLLTVGDINMEMRMRSALAPVSDDLRINTVLAFYTMYLVMMGFSVAVPVMIAETVPLDHQYQVTDLFNSLPVNRTTYLLGKLLGVWLSLLMGLAVCALICVGIMWLILGEFDVLGYLLLWALYVVPITLFNSALGTLLGSTQPSRRRAIFLTAPLGLYPYTVVLFTMNGVWELLSVLRPMTIVAPGMEMSRTSAGEVYLFLALNVAVAWVVAWVWQRMKARWG